MRFEIRYFYLEIGLSLKGLTQSQESYSRKLPNYRQKKTADTEVNIDGEVERVRQSGFLEQFWNGMRLSWLFGKAQKSAVFS